MKQNPRLGLLFSRLPSEFFRTAWETCLGPLKSYLSGGLASAVSGIGVSVKPVCLHL